MSYLIKSRAAKNALLNLIKFKCNENIKKLAALSYH